MQGRRERQMGQQLLLLVVGFVLTSVLGGLLGYLLQSRAWAHQHDVQRRDEERQQTLKTFEEISLLLDRRLYRMRRLYWAARRKAQVTRQRLLRPRMITARSSPSGTTT